MRVRYVRTFYDAFRTVVLHLRVFCGYNRFAIGQIQKNGADHHFSSGNTIASLVNNVYQTDQGRLAYPARESYHLASDFAISK
jgi:hypothetical protein